MHEDKVLAETMTSTEPFLRFNDTQENRMKSIGSIIEMREKSGIEGQGAAGHISLKWGRK